MLPQDDLSRATPAPGPPSRPASRNAFDESSDNLGSAEAELSHLRHEFSTSDPLRSVSNGQGSSGVQHVGAPASFSYAAALGASLSRSTTPDAQRIARAPSPSLTPIGGGRGVGNSEKRSASPNSFNGVSHTAESADLLAALSSMNLSNGMLYIDLSQIVLNACYK